MTDRTTMLQWANVAGLVGGILILLGGALMALMAPLWGGTSWMMGGAAPWWNSAWLVPLGVWGLVTGAVTLLAAMRVEREPRLAGMAMIAAGALSLPAMGGFMLGALAAILGGAFALSAGPPAAAAAPR